MKKIKKAQWFTPLTLVILIFVTVITFYAYSMIWQGIEGALEEQEVFNDSAPQQIRENMNFFMGLLDIIFLFFFVGLIIGTIVSAYFVRSHPIFFVFALIALILAMVVAPTITNIHENITATTEMEDMPTTFPIMTAIMDTLPRWIWVVGLLILIALFAKPPGYSTL